jgi:hypothetical protein
MQEVSDNASNKRANNHNSMLSYDSGIEVQGNDDCAGIEEADRELNTKCLDNIDTERRQSHASIDPLGIDSDEENLAAQPCFMPDQTDLR